MLWITLALAADPQPLICCDEPVITEQLRFYTNLHEKLVTQGAPKATGVLYGWAPKAKQAVGALQGPDRDAMQRVAALTESLKNASASRLREGLVELSQLVTFLAVRHPGGTLEVFEAHCGDRPWLQRDGKKLASPYGECGEWRVPVKSR